MIKFILPGVPPTGTAQQRGYTKKGVSYPKKTLVDARDYYTRLAEFRPKAPMEGPLVADVIFVRPATQSDLSTKAKRARFEGGGLIFCQAKPDTLNAWKVMQDKMGDLGFFTNDMLFVSENIRKARGLEPCIIVSIRQANDMDLRLLVLDVGRAMERWNP